MKKFEIKIHSAFYRQLVFWVGIIATICYRIIIFLNKLPNHFWADFIWYIGTVCFIWYFAHRYNIETKRDQLIKDFELEAKVAKWQGVDAESKKALIYTLKSLQSSLAKWNYIAIFVISGLALAWDIYTRLF